MQFHLDHDHKDLHKPEVIKAGKLSKGANQPSMTAFMTTAKEDRLSKKKVDDITEALLKLLVKKSLPFSLVDNEFFTDFVALLEPRLVWYLYLYMLDLNIHL